MIVDGVIKEIKTKSDCETLYGAGAWRSDLQGTCVTCHDVHNSLFIAEQRESALRKVCTDCHTNKPLAKVWHPTGMGTPLDVSEPFEACITCHMPRATDTGLRMHLWRVNPDANYRTFPTAEEFGIGAPATNKNANASPDGAYTNAVWVDVDYTCGQCHGGSRGPDATRNGAPYIGKDSLAERAAQIHINSGPTISVTADVNGYTVTLTDSSSDDKTLPANAVNVQWGDKKSDNGNAGGTFAHIYSKPKKFVIVYTVTDKDGAKSVKKINIVLHKDSTQAKK
jgi:predicted CXXCH cytochrome family protein